MPGLPAGDLDIKKCIWMNKIKPFSDKAALDSFDFWFTLPYITG